MTNTLIIHRAMGWLADGRRIELEDWPTPALALEALAVAEYILAATPAPADMDAVADEVARQIGIDPARPYGCSIILEPAT